MRKGTPPSIKALSLNKEFILKNRESLALPGTFSTLAQPWLRQLWRSHCAPPGHQRCWWHSERKWHLWLLLRRQNSSDLFLPLACPAVPVTPALQGRLNSRHPSYYSCHLRSFSHCPWMFKDSNQGHLVSVTSTRGCCGTISVYSKYVLLSPINKELTGLELGRRFGWESQTRRILERRRSECCREVQREQDMMENR